MNREDWLLMTPMAHQGHTSLSITAKDATRYCVMTYKGCNNTALFEWLIYCLIKLMYEQGM